jgi:uncharacterized protein (DUF427 family)
MTLKRVLGWLGQQRPPFADTPAAGQESVWDYPRPPAIVAETRHIVVRSYELVLAESDRALRILETASAPGFYIPAEDVRMDLLKQIAAQTYCEWKGAAVYYDLNAPWGEVGQVAWRYPQPNDGFAAIANCISFYPGKVECYVNGERARSQPGGFYGGWVTADVAGPIKGAPGTAGW